MLSIKSSFALSILPKQMVKSVPIEHFKNYIGENLTGESLSLIIYLLKFNPNKRYSALECLNHPYFSHYRNKKSEIILSYDVVPSIEDGCKRTIEEYRKILFDPTKINALHYVKKPQDKTSSGLNEILTKTNQPEPSHCGRF
uniref:Mitogen-activated protein kinase 15 (Trinotate prediction) n=1 Tax=Henneguya salminicola TaxID=69463 RepID=A0A6G3MFS8_HENSL